MVPLPRGECPVHTYTYLILWGDLLHNFVDGIILAFAFLADFRLGMITTLAVILHEIPQEIGDFGILIHGGMERRKAFFYNFLVALSIVPGAVLTYWFGSMLEPILPYALALIAGSFIYLASTDLMPELHERTSARTRPVRGLRVRRRRRGERQRGRQSERTATEPATKGNYG